MPPPSPTPSPSLYAAELPSLQSTCDGLGCAHNGRGESPSNTAGPLTWTSCPRWHGPHPLFYPFFTFFFAPFSPFVFVISLPSSLALFHPHLCCRHPADELGCRPFHIHQNSTLTSPCQHDTDEMHAVDPRENPTTTTTSTTTVNEKHNETKPSSEKPVFRCSDIGR